MKGLKKKEIVNKFEQLPITRKEDIDITSVEIMELLNKKGGSYLKNIYNELTTKILKDELQNEKQELKEYILQHFN